jgi:hypothetical protein
MKFSLYNRIFLLEEFKLYFGLEISIYFANYNCKPVENKQTDAKICIIVW